MAKKQNKKVNRKDWKDRKTNRDNDRYDDRDRSSSQGTGHKFNDVSWYTKNTQMLNDAASYSYNNALGSQVKWSDLISPQMGVGSSIVGTAVPGLMAHYVMMGPGKSIDSSSPANIAGQNIYSYVRYMNSGAKNYDQQDMLMYLLAMDSIYAKWNWLKRIYGYARMYSQYNRYMPRVYAAADNVNLDDIVAQLADFRLYLNQSAAKISAFCVPAVMPLFVRHSWMFSNIYADSSTLKAQQYMFVPAGFYSLVEQAETGTMLSWVNQGNRPPSTSLPLTLQQLRNQLDSLINNMSYSEDVGIMSGDILKAYGEGQLFKLVAVDPDYVVAPVYNEEVLNQMHNSSSWQLLSDSDTSNNISQDPDKGNLIWNPKFQINQGDIPARMINMPWDNVTPANTMVATRLTNLLAPAADGTYRLDACGSEVIIGRAMFVLDYSTIGSVVVKPIAILADTLTTSLTSVTPAFLTQIVLISQFDWHPLMRVIYDAGAVTPKYQMAGLLGDISNYTLLYKDDLEKLHYTAIMSEFNIPQIGSY